MILPSIAKRSLLFILLLISATAISQSQQGFVKTIGRPGKPGVMLSDVVIQAQAMVNPVVSDDEGHFNITIPNKKDGDPIVLLSVRKNGYDLQDKNLTGRQLIYSSRVPIYITMVDLKQLEADRRRIQENAYRVAEENYQKNLSELNQQKEEKEISVERFRQELQVLEDKYEKYLSLVSKMSERYARTDYDLLDSIDYQINLCIENGELDKADSLIHTVFDPETVLERNRAAKQEIMERIAFAQRVIDKANADKEAILNDLKYAEELAVMCDNLALEYIAVEKPELAIPCLEKSLAIKTILFGDNSQEVLLIQQKIQELKP